MKDKQSKGLVQIYTGDGKGKTSAAIGSAVRAAGYGLKVVVIQFLKHGRFECGEEKALKKFKNVKFIRLKETSPLFDYEFKYENLKKQVEKDLRAVINLINSGKYDLVVLDELTYLVRYKIIDEKVFVRALKARPKKVEIIITGRNATPAIIKAADLVSEIKEIKHPLKQGINARKGFEY